MEAKIRKFSSLFATVTSLCNNETANTISHRSPIRLHSATFSKYNTYPSSNGYFQLELLLAQETPQSINAASTTKEMPIFFCIYIFPFSRYIGQKSDISRTKKSSPLQCYKDRRQVGVPSEPRCSSECTPSTLAFVDAVKQLFDLFLTFY